MHNLHLIVVNAENGKDACELALDNIETWGDDNNWRSACGAVSEHDDVYRGEEHSWTSSWIDDDMDTIAKINQRVQQWLTIPDAADHQRLMQRYLDGETLSAYEWYKIQKFAQFMVARIDALHRDLPFDVLEDSFFEGMYNECGVTNCTTDDATDPRWVVFIDMHS